MATASESIRPTTVRDLWILTAGRPLSNPGDLLGSSAFSRMLKSLPSSFDRIVLDSPPVMAFTDASLIAHEQAGIVFVVSADRTGRRAAQAALERLEAVGARFVGAVLNRVAPDRLTYSSYSGDDDEEETYVEYATVPGPPSGQTPLEQETRT
jgi:capsular exopolysaccharide synthesis family protein